MDTNSPDSDGNWRECFRPRMEVRLFQSLMGNGFARPKCTKCHPAHLVGILAAEPRVLVSIESKVTRLSGHCAACGAIFAPSLVTLSDSDIALDSAVARQICQQSVAIAIGGRYLSLEIILPAHANHSTRKLVVSLQYRTGQGPFVLFSWQSRSLTLGSVSLS
jgi:hypothetical protein